MMDNQDTPNYPLSENVAKELKTTSGASLEEITQTSFKAGKLTAEDFRIRDDTLRAQAAIARKHGFRKLADNLSRAAELTRVPNHQILSMYEALRPGRSTFEELFVLAENLEAQFQAPLTAAFVREAAQAYQERNLLRKHAE